MWKALVMELAPEVSDEKAGSIVFEVWFVWCFEVYCLVTNFLLQSMMFVTNQDRVKDYDVPGEKLSSEQAAASHLRDQQLRKEVLSNDNH